MRGLEPHAREAKKGVWGAPIHVPPEEWRKRRSRHCCSSAQFAMSHTAQTNHPHVFLCARSQEDAIVYPFNGPSHVKRGRFSWVFAAGA